MNMRVKRKNTHTHNYENLCETTNKILTNKQKQTTTIMITFNDKQ